MTTFGPGTFTVGDTDGAITASCLVNSLTIAADKDQGDSTTKLCGTVVPGATTYTYTLSGNVDTDSDDAKGLFALSQSAKGEQLPFTFTPFDGGTEADGTVIIDPLDFGGDTYGEAMTSDFEWAIVGEPEYVYPTPPEQADWWKNLVVKPDTENTDVAAAEQPAGKTDADLVNA